MELEEEIRRLSWPVWIKSRERKLPCSVRGPTGSMGTVRLPGRWRTGRLWLGRMRWGLIRGCVPAERCVHFFFEARGRDCYGADGEQSPRSADLDCGTVKCSIRQKDLTQRAQNSQRRERPSQRAFLY